MSFANISDKSAVIKALDEFEAIGRDAFLKKYGYGPARSAFIKWKGRLYDSKAILGAAHGYQFPTLGPLSWKTFSGGEAAAAPKLRDLGFDVTTPPNSTNQPVTRAWLFQANPQMFDIRRAIKELEQITWTVSSYRDQIQKGDHVYIWEAGPVGGVIGTGSIVEATTVRPMRDAEFAFVRNPEKFEGEIPRCVVGHFVPLAQPLGRDELKSNEVLSELMILRAPQGTNFAVTPAQHAELQQLMGHEMQQNDALGMNPDEFRQVLQQILGEYRETKVSQPFGKDNSIWRAFEAAQVLLEASEPVRKRPHIRVSWSCGQGNWSRVPWIALLDSRETSTTQRGVYCVYLFREDMSGVFLTLNQGVTEPIGRLGRVEGRRELNRRADSIRDRIQRAQNAGFSLDNELELRTTSSLGRDYERATIAHKFYSSGELPSGDALIEDVENLLSSYEDVATSTPPPPQANRDLRQVSDVFAEALLTANINYGSRHFPFVRAFVASLATKPFVILTGLSGSGKTQLALKFGEWLGKFAIVPVRPDWTGAEALFGYEDALQEPLDGRSAWHVPEQLEFMLGAVRDPENPYLLLLDEMNLAHVERYFADVLSGMESQDACLPDLSRDEDGQWRHSEPEADKVQFPRNLFIAGTVNVDETTYMFSPKVLDRANTLEFRVQTDDLAHDARRPTTISPGDPALVRGFLDIATDDHFHLTNPAPFTDFMVKHLRLLHALLAEANFEFGHRVFYEALRFSAMLHAAGEPAAETALDLQVLQKVLPRLHGSRRRLEPLLRALAHFAYELTYEDGTVASATLSAFDPLETAPGSAQLQMSFDKLQRMIRILRANQFVSFAE